MFENTTGESVRSPEVLSPPSPEVPADIIFYQRSIHLIPIFELILKRIPDSGVAKVINEDVEDAEAIHWATSSEGLVLTDGHVKIGIFSILMKTNQGWRPAAACGEAGWRCHERFAQAGRSKGGFLTTSILYINIIIVIIIIVIIIITIIFIIIIIFFIRQVSQCVAGRRRNGANRSVAKYHN